jgi:hypothetical protein
MKTGYYSSVMSFKLWDKCPIWIDSNGNRVKVSFVITKGSKLEKSDYVKYNNKKYSDLRCLGDLLYIYRQGIHKPKAIIGYQELN